MCKNAVGLRQEILDRAILAAIAEVLHPSVLAAAIDKAVAMLTSGETARVGRRLQLERDLADAQLRIDRLVGALADGTLPADEIRPRLVAEKARKTALADELARLHGRAPQIDATALRRDLEARAADVVALLTGETEQARQVLRTILHDKIHCEPFGRGRQRGYRFRGSLRIERVICGSAGVEKHAPEMVAPTGFVRLGPFAYAGFSASRRSVRVALGCPPPATIALRPEVAAIVRLCGGSRCRGRLGRERPPP
jgi:hypothetical protein